MGNDGPARTAVPGIPPSHPSLPCTAWEPKWRISLTIPWIGAKRPLFGGPSTSHGWWAEYTFSRDKSKQAVKYKNRDGASARAERPKLAFIRAPAKAQGPRVLWSGQVFTFFDAQEMKRRSYARANQRAPWATQGPNTLSLRKHLTMLARTQLWWRSNAGGQALAYFHLGPVYICCYVHRAECSMAWPLCKHIVMKDQVTHSFMYWNWNEAYVGAPKVQVYVHQRPICPSCNVQEQRGSWKLRPKHRPQ